MGWWLDYVASMWTITAVWQQNTTTNEAMNGQHAEMLWYVLLVLRMKTGNNGGALPSMRDRYVLRLGCVVVKLFSILMTFLLP